MKIIDGTFTLDQGIDFELEKETNEYLDSLLEGIDMTRKTASKELAQKVITLPVDKQLYAIYGVLDRCWLTPEVGVVDILKETTGEDFGTKKKRKKVTREKYPELFNEIEMKTEIYQQFLAQPEFNRFREFVMYIIDWDIHDSKTPDLSKYEEEFGIKINIYSVSKIK